MKEYDVKVGLYKNVSFKVKTLDEVEALSMVKDIIENSELKDIEQEDYEIESINIAFNDVVENDEVESDFTIPFVKVQE